MRFTIILLCFWVVTAHARMALKPVKKGGNDTAAVQQISKPQETVSNNDIAAETPNNIAKQDTANKSKVSLEQKIILNDSARGLPVSDTIIVPLIDFKNQDIRDALRLLSAPYDVNLYLEPEVQGKVTLRLTNIKLKDALKFIILENGYQYRLNGGIIQVYKPKPPPAPLAPPPPPVEQIFKLENGNLTVDLKNAEMDSVIRWVAAQGKMNLVPDKGVTGKLSGFFVDMQADKGLQVLFESNGFTIKEINNIRYITRSESRFGGSTDGTRLSVNVEDSLVSFEVTEAPLSAIIREIALQTDMDVYIYGSIGGKITAKIKKMKVDEVFESLFRNTQYTFWKSRGIYYIGETSMHETQISELLELQHLKADIALSLIPESLTKKTTLKVVKEFNAIMIISPTRDNIEEIKEYIAKIDKPVAQILIEAWVVDISIDKLRSYGLKLFTNLGKDTGAYMENYFPDISVHGSKKGMEDRLQKIADFFSIKQVVKLPENFAAQIDALEQEGIGDVISKPQIATLNGHPASISIGATQYFLIEKTIVDPSDKNNVISTDKRFETINANVTLSVTPWVSANNEVTVEIQPDFSIPKGSLNYETPPTINRRTLTSTVRLRDGEMIILGGLIQTSTQDSRRGVPILSSIPIIKWLFSTKSTSTQKSQLMIYLVPHIYYSDEGNVKPEEVLKR